jgi:dTDP-4-amino-4,6-dideoxygalactose transaminase
LCGVPHAVAVNNGTTALTAALEALRTGPGAEVLTSPLASSPRRTPCLSTGARVHFADVRADDFTIDPDAIENALSGRTAS